MISTRREQRIADVALLDILRNVVDRAPSSGEWLEFSAALRATDVWGITVDKVEAAIRASSRRSLVSTRGYFWSSMLACAVEEFIRARHLTRSSLAGAVKGSRMSSIPHQTLYADHVLYPRTTTVRLIEEIGCDGAVDVASDVIADAFSNSALSADEKLLVAAATGAAICPDLWRFPAGVKIHLRTAIRELRNMPGNLKGLQMDRAYIENSIDSELAQRWKGVRNRGNVW